MAERWDDIFPSRCVQRPAANFRQYTGPSDGERFNFDPAYRVDQRQSKPVYARRTWPWANNSHLDQRDNRRALASYDLPNVNVFAEQVHAFRELLAAAPPNEAQSQDTDFLMAGGELFALVVYASAEKPAEGRRRSKEEPAAGRR